MLPKNVLPIDLLLINFQYTWSAILFTYPHISSASCSGRKPTVACSLHKVGRVGHKVYISICTIAIHCFVGHSILSVLFEAHPFQKSSITFCTITDYEKYLFPQENVIV